MPRHMYAHDPSRPHLQRVAQRTNASVCQWQTAALLRQRLRVRVPSVAWAQRGFSFSPFLAHVGASQGLRIILGGV